MEIQSYPKHRLCRDRSIRWFIVALIVGACSQLGLAIGGGGNPSLARLTYKKVWKGSVPEYTKIVVDKDGVGTFEARSLAQPPNPRPITLSIATTRKLFELAAELKNFNSINLESRQKVANLGLKTLIYEGNGEKNEIEFNYTGKRQAQELVDLFDKISTVEQHVTALNYGIKYDPLGLPAELQQIRIDLENNALTDAELMIPDLRQIERNPRFLNLARVRARYILAELQKKH